MSRTLLALLTALLVLAACTGTPPPQEQGGATPTSPAPTSTPALVLPLLIEDSGYVQDGDTVAYGFTVHNPNPDLTVEASDYRVVAYAEDETALGSQRGRIARIAPEAIWGVGGQVRLESSAPVARLDIVLTDGDAAPFFPTPAFVVDSLAVFRTLGEPRVWATAVMHSPYHLGASGVPVAVIFLNEDGDVLSGAMTYVSYIPGEGQVGLSVSTEVEGVTTARFFPAAGSATTLHDPRTWPAGAVAPEVVAQGFVQDQTSFIWAAEVRNASDRYALQRWRVALTVYDAADRVLATSTAHPSWLLDGQQRALTRRLLLPEDQRADRVAVAILPEDFVPAPEVAGLPRFGTEAVTFEAHDLFPKVHGRIVNPTDRDVTYIQVVALLYDAQGAIVGAGATYLDFIPASGKAAVAVHVAGDAARTERATLSATVTSRSD